MCYQAEVGVTKKISDTHGFHIFFTALKLQCDNAIGPQYDKA